MSALYEALQQVGFLALVFGLALAIRWVLDHYAYLQRQNRRVNRVLPKPDKTTLRRPVVDPEWDASPGHIRTAQDTQ